MKKFLFALVGMVMALSVNAGIGAVGAVAIGVPAIYGSIALNAVSLGVSSAMPTGILRAGVFTEVWTGYAIKKFREAAESLGWYNKIRDFSQYAENDVIHFVNIGGDPTVLVNNTTYPLGIETLDDADKAISLDKYQSLPTRVTDDELYAVSYDKMATVIERHREAISEKKFTRAIHGIAPDGNTPATPVVYTTGSVEDSRKILTVQDIIKLKKRFDKLKVPAADRILVLCADHVADLLLNDQKFAQQYYNYTSGKICNLYGFEVYEYNETPYYDTTTDAKVPYGSVPAANDRQASIAFCAGRMMRANGTTKTYAAESKNNPTMQENLISFRTYSICLPLKKEAMAAIVSAKA